MPGAPVASGRFPCRMRIRSLIGGIAALSLLAACKDSTGPGRGVALQVLSGDDQRATAGAELPIPVSARVVDRDGVVLGQRVDFRVLSGGGSATPATTSTNLNGVVSTTWKLGTSVSQTQQLEIAVVDAQGKTVAADTVDATAVAGSPAGLQIVSGNNQSGEVGFALAAPFVVRVVDAGGNPVAGAPVAFQVATGGGSLGTLNTVTDASGLARSTLTLGGPAGAQTVTAATSVGAPITLTATGNPGPVTQLVTVSGSGQADTVTQTLPQPIVVQTADRFGNLVTSAANAGRTVTFAEQPGSSGTNGGTFSPTTTTLDAQGRASAMWTLGTESGLGAATATATGLGAAGFSVTALPGPATSIAAFSATTDTTTAGTTFTPTVRVVDQFGNPVSDAVIRGTVVSGGGGFEDADSAVTGANGSGGVAFTLGITPGTNVFQQTVAGVGTVTFTIVGEAFVAPPPGGPSPQATPTSVTAGDDLSCALDVNGKAFCWGAGYGTTPVAVGGSLAFKAITAGDDHVCGITTTGEAYCWGDNSFGQLGNGSSASSSTPVEVSGGFTWTHLSAGYGYTCGITTGGVARCWGRNNFGQLGTGGGPSSTPAVVAGGMTWATISGSVQHTCGVTTAGQGFCWGRNENGQIGDGTEFNTRPTPTAVAGGLPFSTISAGGRHSCGLITSGAIYCWGSNTVGQLGSGTIGGNATTPRAVRGGITFTGVATGFDHSCGVAVGSPAGGDAFCWGADYYGQLGTGSSTTTGNPSRVSGGIRFLAVDGGGYHTCGIDATGATYCWGLNASGQLGTGSTANSPRPAAVRRR